MPCNQPCHSWFLLLGGMAIALSSCSWAQGDLQPQSFNQDAAELTVVGFNVESGGADASFIAERHLAPLAGVDLWGFSEVENREWLRILEQGAEAGEPEDFQSILGQTGGGDRLAVVYNSNLLSALQHDELDEISLDGRVRAALVVHFQVVENGQEFLFMVNHLYRTDPEQRHNQAQMLNEWAQNQSLPIIAVGDYNFDFDVAKGDQGNYDPGLDLMLYNDIFHWIRPQVLTASHCNTRYNTILDFIFVDQRASQWSVQETNILFAEPDSTYCPDDDRTSDHHPVLATFMVPPLSQN